MFEDNLLKNVETAQQNAEKFCTLNSIRKITGDEREFRRKRYAVHPNVSPRKIAKYEETQSIFCSSETEIVQCHNTLDLNIVDETTPEDECVDINTYCRLCAQVCHDLISIFDEHGNFHIETDCFRLMPQDSILKDDGLPQHVCCECLEKLQSCVNIIDGFVTNQTYFITE